MFRQGAADPAPPKNNITMARRDTGISTVFGHKASLARETFSLASRHG